jgi:hypothetical protein
LLGSLNDFSLLARTHFITKRDDPLDIIVRELAEVPAMPMKGKHPSAVTGRLFEVALKSAAEGCPVAAGFGLYGVAFGPTKIPNGAYA